MRATWASLPVRTPPGWQAGSCKPPLRHGPHSSPARAARLLARLSLQTAVQAFKALRQRSGWALGGLADEELAKLLLMLRCGVRWWRCVCGGGVGWGGGVTAARACSQCARGQVLRVCGHGQPEAWPSVKGGGLASQAGASVWPSRHVGCRPRPSAPPASLPLLAPPSVRTRCLCSAPAPPAARPTCPLSCMRCWP